MNAAEKYSRKKSCLPLNADTHSSQGSEESPSLESIAVKKANLGSPTRLFTRIIAQNQFTWPS